MGHSPLAPASVVPDSANPVLPVLADEVRPARWGDAALVAWALALAFTCLWPAGGDGAPSIEICVLCGDRGIADGTLNALLYLPLGMYLRLRHGWAISRIMGAAFCLSLCIEVAQLAIPGRFSSTGDLAWNSLGGALGAWWAPRIAQVLSRQADFRATLVVTALVGLVALAPGVLFVPATRDAPLFVGWNPDLADMEGYPGPVLSSELAGTALRPGSPVDARWMEESLLSGHTLRVAFLTTPSRPGMSPLFHVTDGEKSAVLVTVRRTDFVIELRTRATSLGLDSPLLLFPGQLEGANPGDTTVSEIRWDDRAGLVVESATRRSALAPRPDRGWALLLGFGSSIPTYARVADAVWMMLLLFPLGLVSAARRDRMAVLLTLGGACAAAVAWTVLEPPALESLGAGIAAWLLGTRRPPWTPEKLDT